MTNEVHGTSKAPAIPTPEVILESDANKPTKTMKIRDAENQGTTLIRPSQLVLDVCPSQSKHFFCGMAKKLGCQFCAKSN